MWDSLRKTLWWEPVSDQLLSKMWMYCLFRKCFSSLIFSWLENSEIFPYALLNCLNPQSFEAYFPWVSHLKEYKLHYIQCIKLLVGFFVSSLQGAESHHCRGKVRNLFRVCTQNWPCDILIASPWVSSARKSKQPASTKCLCYWLLRYACLSPCST